MKDKGVLAMVDRKYYQMLEKTRIILKNKYGIKVKSHTKLTKLMSLAPPPYMSKSWIRKVKKSI